MNEKFWENALKILNRQATFDDLFKLGCGACLSYGGTGYLRLPKSDGSFGYDVTPCQCLFLYEHYQEAFYLLQKSNAPLNKLRKNPLYRRTVSEGEISGALIKRLIDRNNLIDLEKPWVHISGSTGTGKTYLSTAFIQAAVEDEIDALYVSWPSLLASMRPNALGAETALERASEVSVLVLDDFGQEKVSEWSTQQLYMLINTRYESLLPTIFVSNVPIASMRDTIGAAAQSRLLGHCVELHLVGEDRRQT